MAERIARAAARIEAGAVDEVDAPPSGYVLRPDQARVFHDFAAFLLDLATDPGAARSSFGRIILPPRTGKTVIAGHLIARTGLRATRWAEVGVQAGSQRLGGELRFAVLDEDVRDSFSMALGGGFYYSAIGDGPWGRAGVDISTRLGSVAPLLNVYVSHGATYHSARVDLPGDDDCPLEGYPGLECGVLYSASSMETRLSVAVGLAWALGEEAALSFGAVPHVVLHATRPEPEEGSPEIVHHDAGLHLVFGVQTPGW